jgi:transcriptional regulator with XRE-family HTH domain
LPPHQPPDDPYVLDMDFPERLATLRKERGLTQPALAERIGVHASQLRRYEAGTSQPTLDVLRRLATALTVSADLLLFDTDERGPTDDLRLIFEAAGQLDDHDKQLVRELIEAVLLRHDAKRWTNAS